MHQSIKSKKFKAAIIGAGNIGAFYDNPKSKDVLTHAHGYSKHPNFDLVGIVDIDFNRAEVAAKIWGAKPYRSVEDLFKSQQVDVVSVCVPDEAHFSVMCQLEKYHNLKGGIVEKPLTNKHQDSKKVVNKAFFKQRPFLVNYMRNFIPEFIELRRDILMNRYGNLISGHVSYDKGLLHNGSHALALLDFFGFKFGSFKKFSQIADFKKDDPSCGFIINCLKGGTVVFNPIPRDPVEIFEIDLIFQKCRLRFINNGFLVEKYFVKPSDKFKGYSSFGQPEIIKTSLNLYGYFTVDSLYRSLIKKTENINSLAKAYAIQELCHKIIKAS